VLRTTSRARRISRNSSQRMPSSSTRSSAAIPMAPASRRSRRSQKRGGRVFWTLRWRYVSRAKCPGYGEFVGGCRTMLDCAKILTMG
jgi:hypothetical protein